MKTFLLAAVALSSFASPAEPVEAAACRHFRYWRYPWPQHCGMTPIIRAPAVDRSWYVEITRLPPLDDEDQHAIGVEALRKALQ
jgi:hypothetical protein